MTDTRTPLEIERDAYAWAYHYLCGALIVALEVGIERKDYEQGTDIAPYPYGVRNLPRVMREVDDELAKRMP